MPNTKSAKKRLLQNEGRRARNRATKSTLKTLINRVLTAVAGEDREKAVAEFKLLTKQLDKAAAKDVIHANRAARVKARLSAKMKAAKPAAAAKTKKK